MQNEYQALLEEAGALIHGHFVYSAGGHGQWYVNKIAGLIMPSHAKKFGAGIAMHFVGIVDYDAFVAPELGAITLMTRVADESADWMGDSPGIIAERDRDENGKPLGTFSIKRGQARYINGKKVIIIEDLLTTGTSVKGAIAAVRAAGGEVVAVGALWNRGGVTAEDLGVSEVFSLVDVQIKAHSEDECPFCKEGIPINTDFGKGKEYLARKSATA